jgi:hypothetical protein
VGKFIVGFKSFIDKTADALTLNLKSQQAQTFPGACCHLSTNIIQLLFS